MKVRAVLSFGWFVDAQIIVDGCDSRCKQRVAELLSELPPGFPLSCQMEELDRADSVTIICPAEINTDNTDDVFYRRFIKLYSDAVKKLKARVERAAGSG